MVSETIFDPSAQHEVPDFEEREIDGMRIIEAELR